MSTERIIVGNSLTLLKRFVVTGQVLLYLQLDNEGAGALAAFSIKAKIGNASQSVTIKSSGFTSADLLLPFASSNPSTLAANSSCLLTLNVEMFSSVELWAQSASSSTLVLSADSR